jgi:DmsE family decaheme c-type cytochrome
MKEKRPLMRLLAPSLLCALMWTGHARASEEAVPAASGAAAPAVEAPAPEAEGEKAPPKKKVKRPRVDLVMKGDAECTICHDEGDDYPVLAIAKTRHGVGADERTPTCISCHGPSTQHRHAPKGGDGVRPGPDMPFGKKTINDVKKHNQACVACHQGDKLTLWAGSTHSRRDVACTQCHQLHTQKDKATARSTVADMCMNCHTEKRAMFKRPSRHPVLEGKMVCTDCHAAHGSAGPKLMLKDSVVETCYTCHMETRGPFLWNHLPVTQDCSICHNPHGTVVPNLLKQRVPFLCQQCHEPTNHRGNVPSLATAPGTTVSNGLPSTPTTAFGRGNQVPAQGRACNNCHNNIHGGNNSTNSTGNSNSSRTMRR